jgi:hypothetical protein
MEELLPKVFMKSKADDLHFFITSNVTSIFECSTRQFKSSPSIKSLTGMQQLKAFIPTKLKVRSANNFQRLRVFFSTLKSTAHNNHGLLIEKYNILCKTSNLSTLAKKLQQEFTGFYLQHLRENDMDLQENHQAVRVTSRLPRSDNSSGTIPSMDSRASFFHSFGIHLQKQPNQLGV